MKRLISLLLCFGLLSGFSAYALGASAPVSYDEAIGEIQALCEQEAYEDAYALICSLSPCEETAVLLEEMIEQNTLDMVALRADYSANSVRAEKMYSSKFFFIRGVVRGFSSSVFGDEDYMILDIEDCSDDVHCYDMTEEDMLSVNSGDEVIVVGNYAYDYGWIGIDFRSCSIVDPAYLNSGFAATTEGSVNSEFCPNCGQPVAPNGKFCSFCGEPLNSNNVMESGAGLTAAFDLMEEAAGTYILTEAKFDDDDLNELRDQILKTTTLSLYADGTGEIELLGEFTSLTWDEFTIDTGDGNPDTWKYSNGKLYLRAVGESLVFKRVEE